jgi:hypothetical protein
MTRGTWHVACDTWHIAHGGMCKILLEKPAGRKEERNEQLG